jgi:hypothetical protein
MVALPVELRNSVLVQGYARKVYSREIKKEKKIAQGSGNPYDAFFQYSGVMGSPAPFQHVSLTSSFLV